ELLPLPLSIVPVLGTFGRKRRVIAVLVRDERQRVGTVLGQRLPITEEHDLVRETRRVDLAWDLLRQLLCAQQRELAILGEQHGAALSIGAIEALPDDLRCTIDLRIACA